MIHMPFIKDVARLSILAVVLSTVGTVFAQNWDPTPRTDPDADSDKSLRPIVFVHGQNGAGEQFERQAKHFNSNGYPVSWINTFDYNTARRDEDNSPDLDAFIDEVLARTGAKQVDLAGHSRGTGVAQKYLRSDPKRAAKVAHYANVAGRPSDNAGGVPTLVIGSLGDLLVGPSEASGDAVHVLIPDMDHVAVMTCRETFAVMHTFFNDGKAPTTLDWARQQEILVGGYAQYYITNFAAIGAKVEVWEVEQATGFREGGEPLVSFSANDQGEWGPFRAEPAQHYEFVVTHDSFEGPKHFYREPFTRTNMLMYIRLSSTDEKGRPSPLDIAPEFKSDVTTILSIRHEDGSVFPRKHSLRVNGTEIASEATTPEKNTCVGIYIVDTNQNGKSDNVMATEKPWAGIFISTIDMHLRAGKKESIAVEFQGRTINVPALASSKEGLLYVVFD